MVALKNAYLELRPCMPTPFLPEWAVVMFAYRESSEVLAQSIRALLLAIRRNTVIDIIVNGNEQLASEAARFVNGLKLNDHSISVSLRVWKVAQGDKAHAWNQYLYGIWEGAETVFFVDGYVRVHPTSLTRISDALARDNYALAATGVPSQGISAANMRRQLVAENGLHGNLHAIRGTILTILRQQKFILPAGIYRTDSLIGAAIKFNLDPTQYSWDPQRIHVVEDASWDHTPLSAVKLTDWITHFRRLTRQGQGVFENLAVRRHLSFYSRSLETLPETSRELVRQWMQNHPRELLEALVKHPLAALSLKRIKKKRDWSEAITPPFLMTKLISTKSDEPF